MTPKVLSSLSKIIGFRHGAFSEKWGYKGRPFSRCCGTKSLMRSKIGPRNLGATSLEGYQWAASFTRMPRLSLASSGTVEPALRP